MTTPSWPWPDDRLTRRSRIARMYRDRLADEAPQACAELDMVLRCYGQGWILDGLDVDPEALLTARQLAELADVGENAVRNWIFRWPLRCFGVDATGHNLYRWGDVLDRQRKRAT